MTDVSAGAGAEARQETIRGGQIAAAVLGNALEFYDFTTYALFAVQIGNVFFPFHDSFTKLMASLLTFGVGFVARPVGAVVLGAFGDRAGRRPAMLVSFMLMGLGILGLVLIPPYAVIGPAAPVLLVVCRLVQGFALGGEVGPTTAFLIEAAPAKRRAFIGSWQSASQAVASLFGATIGLLMTQALTHAQLEAFGWRIAFGLGAVVLPFGLMLRRSLPETLHRPEAASALHPTDHGALSHARPILLGLAMIMSFTTSTYVLLYMTTYATQTLHIAIKDSFGPSVANGFSGIVFALLGGFMADRFGRKPVMITARTILLLVTFPAFWLIVRNHDAATLTLATGILSACSSTSVGVALVALTESLRKDVRSTGLAVVYAIGVTVFGGAAQPLITEVIKRTGDAMAPAWYLMAAAAVGIVAMSFLKETHPERIEGARALIETA
ncbi:MAG: MFS transporter [Proteobacteria bacterium]|nr:MFS transporter [Pseudomonadota bacterium]